MAVTYLLDTSVVTRLRVPEVRARVQALDTAGLARTAMTDLEVGFSARDTAEWDRLMTALETFELVDIVPSHLTRARQVQRSGHRCCGRGHVAHRAPLRRRLRSHFVGHGPAH